MEYIKIENNIIVRHLSGGSMPEGFINLPPNSSVQVGNSLDLYDENYNLKTPGQLIDEGIIIDNTGVWWNKESKEKRDIQSYDIEVDESQWTKKIPDHDDMFSEWDSESGEWVHNAEKKELSILNEKYFHKKEQLASTDYQVIKAIELGVPMGELYPGSIKERQVLRDEINESIVKISAIQKNLGGE